MTVSQAPKCSINFIECFSCVVVVADPHHARIEQDRAEVDLVELPESLKVPDFKGVSDHKNEPGSLSNIFLNLRLK